MSKLTFKLQDSVAAVCWPICWPSKLPRGKPNIDDCIELQSLGDDLPPDTIKDEGDDSRQRVVIHALGDAIILQLGATPRLSGLKSVGLHRVFIMPGHFVEHFSFRASAKLKHVLNTYWGVHVPVACNQLRNFLCQQLVCKPRPAHVCRFPDVDPRAVSQIDKDCGDVYDTLFLGIIGATIADKNHPACLLTPHCGCCEGPVVALLRSQFIELQDGVSSYSLAFIRTRFFLNAAGAWHLLWTLCRHGTSSCQLKGFHARQQQQQQQQGLISIRD